MISWCLTPTWAVFQIYRGHVKLNMGKQFYHNFHEHSLSMVKQLWNLIMFSITFKLFDFSIFLTLSVPDESYSRKERCCIGSPARIKCSRSWFWSRSGQTKDYQIGICCFSAKHAIRRKKGWLGIVIMCRSIEACQTADCCLTKLAI